MRSATIQTAPLSRLPLDRYRGLGDLVRQAALGEDAVELLLRRLAPRPAPWYSATMARASSRLRSRGFMPALGEPSF